MLSVQNLLYLFCEGREDWPQWIQKIMFGENEGFHAVDHASSCFGERAGAAVADGRIFVCDSLKRTNVRELS